jgi:hypothetical protein
MSCLLKHVIEGKIEGRMCYGKTSYWMNVRKREDTGNSKRKH